VRIFYDGFAGTGTAPAFYPLAAQWIIRDYEKRELWSRRNPALQLRRCGRW